MSRLTTEEKVALLIIAAALGFAFIVAMVQFFVMLFKG
jgi:hypothetical protein